MAHDNQLRGSTHRARVGGSGFTAFLWDGKLLAFARQVATVSPTPVGPGTVPIHPLDEPYPVELITPMAATMGSITLELYELYGAKVWERLNSFKSSGLGPVDIVGIFQAVANTPRPIRVVKVIKPPRIRGQQMGAYTEEYNNCVVSAVEDGETIEVGTMEVLKRLTINYTHITRNGRNDVLDQTTDLGRLSDPEFSTTEQF